MALADRLKALKPRGRIQRAVQLTKDQRRALNTEQKRQQRARDRQLVAPTQQFMAELARYDLPLVQLLMAEFALKPANAGPPGRMRLLFLEQYAATCHTKHAEPAANVHVLDIVAAVLRTHKPARDLLEQRLVAAIGFTAQSYSGAHRVAARGARILGGGAGGCAASAW